MAAADGSLLGEVPALAGGACSAETRRSDIPANIAKLSGLVGRKVIVFTARPLLATHEVSARESLGPDALLLTTGDLDELG